MLNKDDVVNAMRAALAQHGQQTDSEGREITGHSMRVAGAQYLASIGIALTLIQLLARWESAVIARYVRESPLVSMTRLTGLAIQKAGKTDDAVIQHGKALTAEQVEKFLAKWSTKLKKLTREQRHLRSVMTHDLKFHEDMDSTHTGGNLQARDLTAIVNDTNNRIHILDPACASLPTPRQKTRCGWPFADSTFTRLHAAGVTGDTRCIRCWRRVLVDNAAVSSDSSS